MRRKTIRVLDVNIREHLCDLGIVQTFCKKTHKELTIEKGINIVGYIKIKIPLKKWKSKSNMKTDELTIQSAVNHQCHTHELTFFLRGEFE